MSGPRARLSCSSSEHRYTSRDVEGACRGHRCCSSRLINRRRCSKLTGLVDNESENRKRLYTFQRRNVYNLFLLIFNAPYIIIIYSHSFIIIF